MSERHLCKYLKNEGHGYSREWAKTETSKKLLPNVQTSRQSKNSKIILLVKGLTRGLIRKRHTEIG